MHLAKVADLKVISRTSVLQYRDVGKRNYARSDNSSASRTSWKAASSALAIGSGLPRS